MARLETLEAKIRLLPVKDIQAPPRPRKRQVVRRVADRSRTLTTRWGTTMATGFYNRSARACKRRCAPLSTIARLGGDEFAVLLPGAGVEGATQSARSILAVFTDPFALSDSPDLDGHHLTIGASIGIALAPDHGREDMALLRYADIAMYAAKRAGHGYAVYAPP